MSEPNYMYGRIIEDAMDEIATLRAENARDERGDLGPITALLAECADLRGRAAAAEAENQRLVKRVAELENLVVALAESE